MAAGRSAVPVIGVTGDAAKELLKAKPGTAIAFGETERAPQSDAAAAKPQISPNTSQGPSAGGLAKPDLAAAGSALTVGVGGKPVVAGGSAIAAARVAVLAAQLAREQPDLTPKQLRAALIANGAPGELAPDRTGGGAAEGGRQAITADPPAPVSGALDPISVDLNATSSTQVTLRASDGATATPPAVSLVPGTSTTDPRPARARRHDLRPARGAATAGRSPRRSRG